MSSSRPVLRSMIEVRCAAFTCMAFAGDSTVTAPAPLLAAAKRRQPRRTGGARAAGKDADMAALVFVRIDGRHREIAPARASGMFSKVATASWRDDRVADADVGEHDLAASLAPRQQQMAGFLAREGHGDVGAKCLAEDVAAVAGDTGRQIDGDDRQVQLGRNIDRPGGIAGQRLGQPCPVERVDHDRARLGDKRRQWPRLDRTFRRGERRIASRPRRAGCPDR